MPAKSKAANVCGSAGYIARRARCTVERMAGALGITCETSWEDAVARTESGHSTYLSHTKDD